MTKLLQILELRAADGAGGGPEKTILNGAALSDPSQFSIRVAYLRRHGDRSTEIADRAQQLKVNYEEWYAHGPLDLRPFRTLLRTFRKQPFDLIHSHDYKSNFLAWWCRRKLGVPILSTAHGWTGHTQCERRVYYPADRLLLRAFTLVISVSNDITEQLIRSRIPATRIRTIPNGIDATQFQPGKALRDQARKAWGVAPDVFVIGGVGRLEPQKRFDLLIDAVVEVQRRTNRPICLLVAGNGSLREDLNQKIQTLSSAIDVRLLGHVRDVRSFYAGLDLFVQASDYEGTSNALLEAMAMEVPIVATLAGGTDAIVQHGRDGLLVPIGDLSGLSESMLSVLSHPDLTRKRVDLARRRVETELSFSTRNRQLEEIYRSLIRSTAETPE